MDTEYECPFCRIIRGELAAPVVYRAESVLAFLDRRPVFPGHTLVVPIAHIETLGELAPAHLASVMTVVQAASRAMESGLAADGSFVAVNNRVSQSVPHLHVHVVPRHRHDGLRGFFWPRSKYVDDENRDRVAQLVRESIERELENEP